MKAQEELLRGIEKRGVVNRGEIRTCLYENVTMKTFTLQTNKQTNSVVEFTLSQTLAFKGRTCLQKGHPMILN